jgi:hypothetical protein
MNLARSTEGKGVRAALRFVWVNGCRRNGLRRIGLLRIG